EQRLKQILSLSPKKRIVDTSLIPAAVLVPICCENGEYHLIFTKRTETVKKHKGQISFPGGACEKWDGTLADTALRECTEEIGLATGAAEILGELDDIFTLGSGYVVTPFVAVIPWPCSLKVDPTEVEEIIKVPISALLDKNCIRQETEIRDGRVFNAYFYNYQGKVIWGATARILSQFLDIFAQVMKNKE
ncbi:MAG: CoA pyrophosphatase, partial [Dehalococcoidales bacterium]|nr:CoA pyrophosphatase [Dehalococcoidales bacterium]